MDKYEYKLKLDQLKSLVSKEDYETAAEIANSINWKKVRNSNTLCMVGDIYEKVGKYEESKAVLLQAYAHSSIGRNIVAKLADVALKAKDLESAESYYNEFVEIAPKDNLRYVIGYKLSCLKDAPLSDRIAILEDFKEKEYSEVWAYELAALYSQADMRDKCVVACDELILWFGDGEYVEKALDLKRRYQPLTPSQEEKYQRFKERLGMVEISIPTKETAITTEDGKPIPEVVVTASKFNTVNLQEELARSMQQIMDATESGEVAESMDNIKKIVTDIPYLQVNEEVLEAKQKRMNDAVDATLKQDFTQRMTAELPKIPKEADASDDQIDGQMNIEDVLAEWERMKVAAEEAMKTAEQRKLEIAKENALAEASEIMERLKALIPIISAAEEEIPEDTDTIAENLKKEHVPTIIKAKPIREEAEAAEEEAEEEAPAEAEDALEPDLIAEIQASMAKDIAEMADEVVVASTDEAAPIPEQVQATAAVQLPIEEEALLTAGLAQEVSAVMNEGKLPEEEPDSTPNEEDEADAAESLFTAGLADSIGALMQEVKAAKAKEDAQNPVDEPVEAAAEEVEEETVEEPVAEAEPEVAEEEAEEAASEETDEEADIEAALEAALAQEIAAAMEEPVAEEPVVEEAVEETVVEEPVAEEPVVAEEVIVEEPEAEAPADDEADIEAALEAALAQEIAAAMEEPAAEEPAVEEVILEEPEAETPADDAADIEAALEAALAQEIAAEETETVEETSVEETPAEEQEPVVSRRVRKSKFAMPESLDDELEEEAPAEAPVQSVLTDEQRAMFTYFLPIEGMESALSKVVAQAADSEQLKAETSAIGNILITSPSDGYGKTVLATNLIKVLQVITGKEEKRIGKISADSLNKRDFNSLIPKMDGGYLIVEKAGNLTKEKVISMSLAMCQDTKGLTVVLEDTKEAVNQIMTYDLGFAQKFNNKINIPEFTIDELINFAKVYANEMECEIDEMAGLALYNKLNNMNRIDHVVTIAEVKDIMDQAIDNAESGGFKKIFSKKYTEDDFLILKEEDFAF